MAFYAYEDPSAQRIAKRQRLETYGTANEGKAVSALAANGGLSIMHGGGEGALTTAAVASIAVGVGGGISRAYTAPSALHVGGEQFDAGAPIQDIDGFASMKGHNSSSAPLAIGTEEDIRDRHKLTLDTIMKQPGFMFVDAGAALVPAKTDVKAINSKDESPMSSYLAAAKYILAQMEAEEAKRIQRLTIPTRVEILLNPDGYSYCVGERRFKQMLKLPHEIAAAFNGGIVLDPSQVKFIEMFTYSCADIIYGRDWASNCETFLEEYNLPRLRKQALCLSPRRFGKTFALCIFVLALMLTVPGITVKILSQNKRTSVAIIQNMRKFLSYMHEHRWRVADQGASDSLKICPMDDNLRGVSIGKKRQLANLSICEALPCTADGLRGTSADVVVMEETAFMPERIFWEVVMPIIMKETVSCLAISTPNKDDNYYSALILAKNPETGESLFQTVMIGLSCDACRSAGKGVECPHRRNMLPSWLSAENQRLAKQIMPPELYRQEQQGEILSSRQQVFNPAHIARIFDRRPLFDRFSSSVGVIFLAIDPSGGSASKSELAMIAGAINRFNQVVIIAIGHAFVTSAFHREAVLVEFMARLRAIPQYRNSLIVNQIEMDLPGSAETIHDTIKRFEPMIPTKTIEGGIEKIGVKTKGNKERYVNETERVLAYDQLIIAANCLCLRGDQRSPERIDIVTNDPGTTLRELKRQLDHFSKIEHETMKHGVPEKHYSASGKHAGPDDLAVVLQILLFHTRLRTRNRLWVEYQEQSCGRKVSGNE